MTLQNPAVVLFVPDLIATRDFVTEHLGYTVGASSDWFIELKHPDHDMRIIVNASTAGASPDLTALQLGFIVDGVAALWESLRDRVEVVEPIQTMDMGERFFLVKDPNGVLYRLIEWVN